MKMVSIHPDCAIPRLTISNAKVGSNLPSSCDGSLWRKMHDDHLPVGCVKHDVATLLPPSVIAVDDCSVDLEHDQVGSEEYDASFNETASSSTGVYFNNVEVNRTLHPLQFGGKIMDHASSLVSKPVPPGRPLCAAPSLWTHFLSFPSMTGKIEARTMLDSAGDGKRKRVGQAHDNRVLAMAKHPKTEDESVVGNPREYHLSPDEKLFVEAATTLSKSSISWPKPTVVVDCNVMTPSHSPKVVCGFVSAALPPPPFSLMHSRLTH